MCFASQLPSLERVLAVCSACSSAPDGGTEGDSGQSAADSAGQRCSSAAAVDSVDVSNVGASLQRDFTLQLQAARTCVIGATQMMHFAKLVNMSAKLVNMYVGKHVCKVLNMLHSTCKVGKHVYQLCVSTAA
jgi:hypothetical protein